jgi:hypothetical protein
VYYVVRCTHQRLDRTAASCVSRCAQSGKQPYLHATQQNSRRVYGTHHLFIKPAQPLVEQRAPHLGQVFLALASDLDHVPGNTSCVQLMEERRTHASLRAGGKLGSTRRLERLHQHCHGRLLQASAMVNMVAALMTSSSAPGTFDKSGPPTSRAASLSCHRRCLCSCGMFQAD